MSVALDRDAHDSRAAATGVKDGGTSRDVLAELRGQHRRGVGHRVGFHLAFLLCIAGEGRHALQLLGKALHLLDLHVLSAFQMLLQEQIDLIVSLVRLCLLLQLPDLRHRLCKRPEKGHARGGAAKGPGYRRRGGDGHDGEGADASDRARVEAFH